MQEGSFQRSRSEDLEIAPPKMPVRILTGNDLALFCNADARLHRAARLGTNGLVARPAATADRTAAAVKQAQRDPMPFEHLDQFYLGLVQLPAGGQEPTVLVAVGIPQHDLLRPAAT